MHENTAKKIAHPHDFDSSDTSNEKKTLRVIILTGVTMVAEVVAGALTGSMALLADGWHMGTHAFALGITFFAYVMARRCAGSTTYSFGTGKFGILAGYTSAFFLGATALFMIFESLSRFISPVRIAFNEAILVSVIGLVVNVVSIWMLHGGAHHEHGHEHPHDHKHDHNLRAAYLHVMADALTSVLAIVALLSGKYFGLAFLDPAMGIVGGVLIGKWAWGLLKSSALILLDGSSDKTIHSAIIEAIQSDRDSRIADLHVWPLGSNELAAVVSVISREQRTPSDYYARLTGIDNLKHVTIETHRCSDRFCACVQER